MSNNPLKSPLIGPGAHHHKDWDKIEHQIKKTVAYRGLNQACFLPDRDSFHLENIKLPMMNNQHFWLWWMSVEHILRAYSLHLLIDINVPRPYVDDPNAQRWYDLSRQLVGVLMSSMDVWFLTDVMKLGAKCTFADEFVATVKQQLGVWVWYTTPQMLSP